MENPPVGAIFVVQERIEFKDGNRHIATYLPTIPDTRGVATYRVTDINTTFVAALVAAGKASVVGFSRARRPAGQVKTG